MGRPASIAARSAVRAARLMTMADLVKLCDCKGDGTGGHADGCAVLRMATPLRRTVLRYRWNPNAERWEFYGHGRPLWRQSVAFSKEFPPQSCYVVGYAETAHELAEIDDVRAPAR